MSYTPTIGLEIHAELKTKSKMFCGCKNAPHESEPNTLTCPVCLAHPGTLPVPNFSAIEHLLLFGRAVDAVQATFTEFDRKSYFYPDIPKAYQISQYKFPFLSGGSLAGVELTRVHLEEDTARNQHSSGDYSLVDFNRAGVPLMELVTEPVIHDATTAVNFARELQLLLRTLDISDANMEKGEMRVEANISVSKTDKFGTKVEVKNLNSFKVVGQAIDYEIERQISVLEKGSQVQQETRGWDEQKSRTFSQRSKETAKDYRYFPDPDIPKLQTDTVDAFEKKRLSEKLPKLPNIIKTELKDLGLTSKKVDQVLADKSLLKAIERITTSKIAEDAESLRLATNYLLTDIVALREELDIALSELDIEQYLTLINMLRKKEINSRIAKDMLPLILKDRIDVRDYAEKNNLLQVQDASQLQTIVEQVVTENESAVEEYRNGKEAALKYLVGQGMKLSKGTADPELLLTTLKDKI